MAIISSVSQSAGRLSIGGLRLRTPEWNPTLYASSFATGSVNPVLGTNGVSSTSFDIPHEPSAISSYGALTALIDFGAGIDLSEPRGLFAIGSKFGNDVDRRLVIFMTSAGFRASSYVRSSGSWQILDTTDLAHVPGSNPGAAVGIVAVNVGFLPSGHIHMSFGAAPASVYTVLGDVTNKSAEPLYAGPWTQQGLVNVASSHNLDPSLGMVVEFSPLLNSPSTARLHSILYTNRESSNVGDVILAPFIACSNTPSTSLVGAYRMLSSDTTTHLFTPEQISFESNVGPVLDGSNLYRWYCLEYLWPSSTVFYPTFPIARPSIDIVSNAIYASASGDDANNGTMLKPVLSLQKAISLAMENDIIILGDGTYSADNVSKSCRIYSRRGAISTISNYTSNADNTFISGVRFTGSVSLRSATAYIDGCLFFEGSSLLIVSDANAVVTGNVFGSVMGHANVNIFAKDVVFASNLFKAFLPGSSLTIDGPSDSRVAFRHNVIYGDGSSGSINIADAGGESQHLLEVSMTKAVKSGKSGAQVILPPGVSSSNIFSGTINEVDGFVYGRDFVIKSGRLYILSPGYDTLPDTVTVLIICRSRVTHFSYNIFDSTGMVLSPANASYSTSLMNIRHNSPGIVLSRGISDANPQFASPSTGNFKIGNQDLVDIVDYNVGRVSGSVSDGDLDIDYNGYRRSAPGLVYAPDIGYIEEHPLVNSGKVAVSESGYDVRNSGVVASPVRSLEYAHGSAAAAVSVINDTVDNGTSRSKSVFYERVVNLGGGILTLKNARPDIFGSTGVVDVADSIEVYGIRQGAGASVMSMVSSSVVLPGETLSNPTLPRDGSADRPYKTLTQGVASSQDLVLVESGTYEVPAEDVGDPNKIIVVPSLSANKIGDFHITDVGPGTWSTLSGPSTNVEYKSDSVKVLHG